MRCSRSSLGRTHARIQRTERRELLAAVDIGSNSFHMVVARFVLGQLRIVDRLRETVRMAAGLDSQGGLDAVVMSRALGCLARFGERMRTCRRIACA